ncbi:MAG: hypothetical protein QXH20_00455 [Candidatus Bathyarchaeia archaeon]
MDKLRFLIETYIDYQKDRIRFNNRLQSLPPELAKETFFKALADDIQSLEKTIQQEIAKELENEPIYTEYLKHQKGVGAMMAGYLIAWLCHPREIKIYGITKKIAEKTYTRKWKGKEQTITLPPYAEVTEEKLQSKPPYIKVKMPPVMEVAENPSKLHKYCGVAPQSKRKHGQPTDYNPKLKTLMWKLFRQLMMANGEWAKIARQVKTEYAKRCPNPEKGSRKLKIHLTTKNIIARRFLTNLWLIWRKMHGLPTTQPYPAKLGHTIQPPFIEKNGKTHYLNIN